MKSAAEGERDHRLLLDVATAMRDPRELRPQLEDCLRALVRHGPSRWAALWLVDLEGTQLRLLSFAGSPTTELPLSLHVEPTSRPETALRALYPHDQGELAIHHLTAQGVDHGILAVFGDAGATAASAAVDMCAFAMAQRVASVRPTPEPAVRDARGDSEIRQNTLDVVAHDLRNPLGALLMSATLLSRTPSVDDRSRKQLDILRRSASRINDLLGDFVDLVAIENDSLVAHRADHPVGTLVKEAIDRCAAAALEKSVHVALEPPVDSSKPTIHCDRERTMQALVVLLRHAVDITPREGSIAVSIEEVGRSVVVALTVDAKSLDAESIPLLGNGYFRARKEARRRLPIEMFLSRSLVLMQGGQFEVRVKSEPLEWTLFLTFPRYE